MGSNRVLNHNQVFGDTSQLMSPLVLKAIIEFAEERSTARAAGTSLPNIGRGIAMAVGLFFLSLSGSMGLNQVGDLALRSTIRIEMPWDRPFI